MYEGEDFIIMKDTNSSEYVIPVQKSYKSKVIPMCKKRKKEYEQCCMFCYFFL